MLFPYTPTDQPSPHFSDTDSPVSTTHTPASPQPHTQGHVAQFPGYSPFPGFHYLLLPQVYPPDPQFVHAPHSTSDSPPGPKLSLQQQLMQFLYPTGPEHIPLLPDDHPEYPHYQHPLLVQSPSFPEPSAEDNGSSNQISSFPVGSFYYFSNVNYSYSPLQYHEVAAATPEHCSTSTPPAKQLPEPASHLHHSQYYFLLPYSAPTAGPATQATTSPTTSSPSDQPGDPQYPIVPVYLLPLYSSYYHFYPTPSPVIPTSEPQKAEVPQVSCPPYTENSCYYSYYNPLYLYPVVPHPMATPTSAVASSPTGATPMIPHLKCLVGNMTVFLPSAHPGSIEVKGQCLYLCW